jgi:Na+/melibiose symporter-like transporter
VFATATHSRIIARFQDPRFGFILNLREEKIGRHTVYILHYECAELCDAVLFITALLELLGNLAGAGVNWSIRSPWS